MSIVFRAKRITLKRILLHAAAAALAARGIAADASEMQGFDIPPGELAPALELVARQTGLELIFESEKLRGIRTRGVTGRLSPRQAVARLIEGTQLTISTDVGGAILIAPAASKGNASSRRSPERVGSGRSTRVAAAAITPSTWDAAGGVEEIIVTANRREQLLRDVGASVSAIPLSEIERKGFDSLEQIAAAVPSVTFNQPVKNRGAFIIRGLAISPPAIPSGNQQDPVSLYFNDAPVSDVYGAAVLPDLRLFDIERIEILRGPQGTLFGSGSLGGTIRIITNKPSVTRTQAAGRVDFGTTDGGSIRQRYDGMVNVPLLDGHMALRAVGFYRDEEGWVTNATLGTRNDSKDWGGRLAWRWEPSDLFSLHAEMLHQDSDPEDGDTWDPALGKFTRASAIPEHRPAKLSSLSLTADYDFPGRARLTSISTWHQSDSATFNDFGDSLGLGLATLQKSQPWDSKFFAQELRLVSDDPSSRFEWVTGAFYKDRRTDIDFLISLTGLDERYGGSIGSDAYFVSTLASQGQELAGYGDATFNITDAFRINGGVRVFHTKATFADARDTLNFDTLRYDHSSIFNESSSTDSTWRAGAAYDFGSALLYANVSKGFRVGQVNSNRGPSLTDPDDVVIPAGYGPDSTINYEIGMKSAWLDGTFAADAAVYYIEWRDMQVDGSRVSDHLSYTANAAEATSKGLEIQLSARPAQELRLYATLTFQEASIDSVQQNIILPASPGDELPGLAGSKYTAGVQYEWSLASGKQMYVRVDGQYVGSSPNRLADGGTNVFFRRNAAFEKVDAAIGVVADWGELALYGENLTNNDAFILNSGGASGSRNTVNTLRPRTAGLRLTVRY